MWRGITDSVLTVCVRLRCPSLLRLTLLPYTLRYTRGLVTQLWGHHQPPPRLKLLFDLHVKSNRALFPFNTWVLLITKHVHSLINNDSPFKLKKHMTTRLEGSVTLGGVAEWERETEGRGLTLPLFPSQDASGAKRVSRCPSLFIACPSNDELLYFNIVQAENFLFDLRVSCYTMTLQITDCLVLKRVNICDWNNLSKRTSFFSFSFFPKYLVDKLGLGLG